MLVQGGQPRANRQGRTGKGEQYYVKSVLRKTVLLRIKTALLRKHSTPYLPVRVKVERRLDPLCASASGDRGRAEPQQGGAVGGGGQHRHPQLGSDRVRHVTAVP